MSLHPIASPRPGLAPAGWLTAALTTCLLFAPAIVLLADDAPAPTKAPSNLTEATPAAGPATPAKAGGSHPPRALHIVAPIHPPELRKKLIAGECNIECLVSEEGHVVFTKVVDATAPEFGKAAEEAVRQWEFQPGERDGKPIAMTVRIPFDFTFTATEVLETVAGRPVFVTVTGTTIPAEQLPTWPMPTHIYQPPYPPTLRGTGKHGKAVISIVVDKTGHVVNPKIVKSTYPEFNMPALATAVRLIYPPQIVGNRNQEAINVSMEIEFEFNDPDTRKHPDATAKPDLKAKSKPD
jgi:TonB family protein